MNLAGFTNPHVFPCSVAFKRLMTWEFSVQVKFHTEGRMNKTDKSELLCLIENVGPGTPFFQFLSSEQSLGDELWGCPRGQIEDLVCGLWPSTMKLCQWAMEMCEWNWPGSRKSQLFLSLKTIVNMNKDRGGRRWVSLTAGNFEKNYVFRDLLKK